MNKLDKWKESNSSFDFNEQLVYQQIKRNKQKVFFKRVLQGCICVFALIFVLTNTSSTYIKATKDIPLLSKLNELLSLNKNMMIAIENDYIQELNLSKKDGNFEVKVDYMVVDEKSVYVFFNSYYKGEKVERETLVESEEFGKYDVQISILTDKEYCGSYVWDNNDEYDVAEYVIAHSDVVEDFVIEQFDLTVTYGENQVSFIIDVDLDSIPKRKTIDVNQIITIQGQELEITKVEIYPLSMRIHTKQNENNKYYIEYAKFEFKINGEVIENGVGLQGISDEYGDTTYFITSPYFISDNFTLTLLNAELIEKPSITTFNTKTNEWYDPYNKTTLYDVIIDEDDSCDFGEHKVRIDIKINDSNYADRNRLGAISPKTAISNVIMSSYITEENEYIECFYYTEEAYNENDILEFSLNFGEIINVKEKVKLK